MWKQFASMAFIVVAMLSCAIGVLAGEAAEGATQSLRPDGSQPQRTITQEEGFLLMAAEAEKGNNAAMLTLGTMYERGIGTPRNFIRALEWYARAAAAGMPEGYYNVGVCYEIGMGSSGNPAEAFRNFEKSAELGLPQGLYKLATLYFNGFGVAKNETWGVELLNRAAATGHMTAANDLGVIYFEGSYGQPKDMDKSFEMFKTAADLGNAEAMKNLAVFYRDGLGKPVDKKEELKWYMLSRRAGFPAGAIDVAARAIVEEIGPEETKKVEDVVNTWIAAFQQRTQAQQAQNSGAAPAQ